MDKEKDLMVFNRAYELLRVREADKRPKVEKFIESLKLAAHNNVGKDYREVPLSFPFEISVGSVLILFPREEQGEVKDVTGTFDVVVYDYENFLYTKIVNDTGFQQLLNNDKILINIFTVDGYAAIEVKECAYLRLVTGSAILVNEEREKGRYTSNEVEELMAKIKIMEEVRAK